MPEKHKNQRIVLVLQGGGALGAYQVGVYQALVEGGLQPDWVAGTSIGAINGAIIVGSPANCRVSRLEAFWNAISRPSVVTAPSSGYLRRLFNAKSALETQLVGQPGFFRPRWINPWFAFPGTSDAVSLYDNAELRDTLHRFIDFNILNSGATRLSLAAVKVTTSEYVFFDTTRQRLNTEHILASAALPPSFPPVDVNGSLYWDGGLYSNTPLDIILDDEPSVNTLCFLVTLFDPVGSPPKTMEDVLTRRKDITYASRAKSHIEAYTTIHNLRRALMALWQQLPEEAKSSPALRELCSRSYVSTLNIIRFTYRCRTYESFRKDFEFSRASIAEHRSIGYQDAQEALKTKPWLVPHPDHISVVVHDVFSTERGEDTEYAPCA